MVWYVDATENTDANDTFLWLVFINPVNSLYLNLGLI